MENKWIFRTNNRKYVWKKRRVVLIKEMRGLRDSKVLSLGKVKVCFKINSAHIGLSYFIMVLIVHQKTLGSWTSGDCSELTLQTPLSQNCRTHSNNSSANCRRIVWVCLTILREWRLSLKGNIFTKPYLGMVYHNTGFFYLFAYLILDPLEIEYLEIRTFCRYIDFREWK